MLNFQIHDSAKALVVEDDFIERVDFFRNRLPQATIVRNPLVAIDALTAREYDHIFLDFDLPCPEGRTGGHVARHLAAMGFKGRVVIHSANAVGANRMIRILEDAGVRVYDAEFSTFDINGAPEEVFELGD